MADQRSEGPTVNVAAAAATGGGFVVVTGEQGRNVLGYSEVPAGTSPQPLQVSLADEITRSVPLQAELFSDDDGDGVYGAGDQPLAGPDGKAVSVAFDFAGKPVVNG